MKLLRNALNPLRIALLACLFITAVFLGCEKNTDGPLSISDENVEFEGRGFFLSASLDSNSLIHLAKDTLYLGMGNIWSFSNCALQSIQLDYRREDSVLWIAPAIFVKTTGEDCAAPYYRPDTTIKVLLDEDLGNLVSTIKVKNDEDSLLDTIIVRRGAFRKDTFNIYLDSAFDKASNYPLKTKGKKGSREIPSVLRVLDSLTPRKFYWRTMEAKCTHRVDMCKSVVTDTLYPESWNINDTNLVPIHYACADSDLVYCINSKWENDSSALGKLQERPDTIWHYSTYYVEKIPDCVTFNSFNYTTVLVGQTVRFIRQQMVPDENEIYCGPASRRDWMIYNLSAGTMVLDGDSLTVVDSLIQQWKKASVAPESLMVKDTL